MEISHMVGQKGLVHNCLHKDAEWRCAYAILDTTDPQPVRERVFGGSCEWDNTQESSQDASKKPKRTFQLGDFRRNQRTHQRRVSKTYFVTVRQQKAFDNDKL